MFKEMKDIEREMGRDLHNTDKGPRVIDLDILFSEKEPMVRYDPPSFSATKSFGWKCRTGGSKSCCSF